MNSQMIVTLIAVTLYLAGDGTPDELIEYAGRVCKHSQTDERDPQRTARFVGRLIDAGHDSVLEHPSATFEICGISRACSHQLVRHRLASYSQESQRAVQRDLYREYVTPPSIARDTDALYVYDTAMYEAHCRYHELLKAGVPLEDARYVLPAATPTTIVMTANLREWRHILELRLPKFAQAEIRHMAGLILELLHEQVAPAVFADLWEVYGNEKNS